jgi:hypothetical protein
VGDPKVGAQYVDALLLLVLPVISQPGDRVDAGQAHSGFLMTEEVCRVAVAVAEEPLVVAVAGGLLDAGLAVTEAAR